MSNKWHSTNLLSAKRRGFFYNAGPRRTRLSFTDDDVRSGVEKLLDGLETDTAIPAGDDDVASGLVGKIWNKRRL